MKKFAAFFCCFMLCTVDCFAKLNYEVQIPVDMEAENSVAAKDKAMIEAQRQAFYDVAGRFVDEEKVEKLKLLSDNEVLYFVQSVSVADEKAGGNKYKANLNVQINGSLLKDYLAENDMIEVNAKDILVVPVYRKNSYSSPLLWEKENEWRQQWLQKGLIKFGSSELKTVADFLENSIELTAEKALYMSSEMYDKTLEAYQADSVYVLYAELQQNGDLQITVKNEKNKSENSFAVYNEDDATLFDKAIEKTVMFISNMERETENAADFGNSKTINGVYQYADMKDWLIKSAAINNLEQVEGIDTKSFGGGKVNFVISYTGSLDDLWAAMQELGISHEDNGNHYIIR